MKLPKINILVWRYVEKLLHIFFYYNSFQVSDPYCWLEDPDSDETKQFVDAQNAITRPFLDECIYKDKIKETVTKLYDYPKYSIPFKYGNRYYQYRNTGEYF